MQVKTPVQEIMALRDFINNLSVRQSPIEASPTRVGQVLTSKLINGKLEAVWDDLANVPQTSTPVSDTTPPNPSLFKTLQNMTYDDKTYEFALAEG